METWLGLLGLFILTVYFRAVQTRWPLSYFAVVDLTGYKVSATPVRYVLFRLLPVLLVSFFISTLVVRSNGRVTLAVLVLVGGHIVLSTGRGLLALLRDSSSFARKIQALLHMVVSGLVIGAGVAGGALALVPELRNLVPRVDEVSSAMWTAALAAVRGAAIIRATQARQIDLAELVRESRGSLGSHLWEMAEQTAAEANADLVLVKAILVVENLQRPSWFRRLERFKGRLIKRGTYGVMQVRAQHPLTDEESIRIAVRSFLADTGPSLAADDGYDSLLEVLTRYNPSSTFVELAQRVYFRLLEEAATENGREADEDWEEEESVEGEDDHQRYLRAGAAGGAALGAALLIIWGLERVARRFR